MNIIKLCLPLVILLSITPSLSYARNNDYYSTDPCRDAFKNSTAVSTCTYLSGVHTIKGSPECSVMLQCGGSSSAANKPFNITYNLTKCFFSPRDQGPSPDTSGGSILGRCAVGDLFNCQGVVMNGTPLNNDRQVSITNPCAVPGNCNNLIQYTSWYPGCSCQLAWKNNAPAECVYNTPTGNQIPATITELAHQNHIKLCQVNAQCMFRDSQHIFQVTAMYNPGDYFKVCPSPSGGGLVSSATPITQCP